MEESDRPVEGSGNEGTQFDLWYRCAALVFWPTCRRAANQCNADVHTAIKWLAKQLGKVRCAGVLLQGMAATAEWRVGGGRGGACRPPCCLH